MEAGIGTLSQGETGLDSDASVAAPTENWAACTSADGLQTRFDVKLYSEGLNLILVQFSEARSTAKAALRTAAFAALCAQSHAC